jgi:hypothetical protein
MVDNRIPNDEGTSPASPAIKTGQIRVQRFSVSDQYLLSKRNPRRLFVREFKSSKGFDCFGDVIALAFV